MRARDTAQKYTTQRVVARPAAAAAIASSICELVQFRRARCVKDTAVSRAKVTVERVVGGSGQLGNPHAIVRVPTVLYGAS